MQKQSRLFLQYQKHEMLLFLLKLLGEGPMKATMLGAAVVWFVMAPLWMKGGDE